MIASRLGPQVLDCSYEHLGKSDSLPHVAACSASFEDWFTAEIAVGLIKRGFTCSGRPRFEGKRKFGDLSVSREDQQLMVEIKIISDYTLDRYRNEVYDDFVKLTLLREDTGDGMEAMLLAILYSTQSLDRESWVEWLKGIKCWPSHSEKPAIRFASTGEVRLCAWFMA